MTAKPRRQAPAQPGAPANFVHVRARGLKSLRRPSTLPTGRSRRRDTKGRKLEEPKFSISQRCVSVEHRSPPLSASGAAGR
jgi:hypothetical protein